MTQKPRSFFRVAAAVSPLLTPGIAAAAVAFGPVVITDVADNKPTFGDVAHGAPTSRGNDGIDGNANAGNWTHADYPTSAVPYPGQATNAPNPYWEVDLQGSFDLSNVVLTDRVGCCDPSRLHGSVLTFMDAGGATIATETVPSTGAVNGQSYNWDNGGAGYGNVARVRIDGVSGGAPIRWFQFSEFDAFALIQQPINWAAGAFVGFYDAAGAPHATWPGQPATNLTDGNLATVAHGANPLPHADYFWEIDLGQEIFVDNVDITGRGFADSCCPDRLQNYRVEFLDAARNSTHVHDQTGITQFTDNIDVIGATGGNGPIAQYVRIINTNGNDYGPQVGEVQVYGVMVPEPSALAFLTAGLALLFRRRRA